MRAVLVEQFGVAAAHRRRAGARVPADRSDRPREGDRRVPQRLARLERSRHERAPAAGSGSRVRRHRRAGRRGGHALPARRSRHRPVRLRLRDVRAVPRGRPAGVRASGAARLHAVGIVRGVRRRARGRPQPRRPAGRARLRRGGRARLPVRDGLSRRRHPSRRHRRASGSPCTAAAGSACRRSSWRGRSALRSSLSMSPPPRSLRPSGSAPSPLPRGRFGGRRHPLAHRRRRTRVARRLREPRDLPRLDREPAAARSARAGRPAAR